MDLQAENDEQLPCDRLDAIPHGVLRASRRAAPMCHRPLDDAQPCEMEERGEPAVCAVEERRHRLDTLERLAPEDACGTCEVGDPWCEERAPEHVRNRG